MTTLMERKIFIIFVVIAFVVNIQHAWCSDANNQTLQCYENMDSLELYNKIVENIENFEKNQRSFPTELNKINHIAGDNVTKKRAIGRDAKSAYPLIDSKVLNFFQKYLDYKKQNGSELEKQIYKDMDMEGFIFRLINNRPLTLYNYTDNYFVVHDKKMLVGEHNFHQKNIDEWNGRYLLNDERNCAALLGMTSYVEFINTGSRGNKGQKDSLTYISRGVYAGLVGACFEQEWQVAHLMVKDQKPIADEVLSNIWLELLATGTQEKDYIDMAVTNEFSSIYKCDTKVLFDTIMFKNYLDLILRPFFLDAHKRGMEASKKVYVHMVGLGLGVWALNKVEQAQWFVEVCEKIFYEEDLSQIGAVDFSYFPERLYTMVGQKIDYSGGSDKQMVNFKNSKNNLSIYFSLRNPADILDDLYKTFLLVAMFAWDGGSQIGNEYWKGMLTATGDTAAAACSTVAQMQMPELNPCIKENIKRGIQEKNGTITYNQPMILNKNKKSFLDWFFAWKIKGVPVITLGVSFSVAAFCCYLLLLNKI